MPQLPWTEIETNFPIGHLVVGIVEEGSFIGAVRLIEKFLRTIPIYGDFAIGTLRENVPPEIYCVFKIKADADRLTSALQAHSVGRHSGWKSQRQFTFNNELREFIGLVLSSGSRRLHARGR